MNAHGKGSRYPEVLPAVKASASKIAAAIKAAGNNSGDQLAAAPAIMLDKAGTRQSNKQVIWALFDFVTFLGFNLTQADLDLISPALQTPPQGIPLLNVIGNIIAYRAGLGWTTLGHTGEWHLLLC